MYLHKQQIINMGTLVNILVGWTLFLLIQGHNAEQIESTVEYVPHNDTTGTKKADIIATPITLVASFASTYIKNWLSKTQSAVMSIVNLSDDHWMEDGCDSTLNTDLNVPPTNLQPKDGVTEVEASVDTKGSKLWKGVKAGFGKVFGKSHNNHISSYIDSNLWMRCAFKKPRGDEGESKIVIFITLRSGLNTPSTTETTLFIAMCQDGADVKDKKENCENFDTVYKVRDMLEKYNDDKVPEDEKKKKDKDAFKMAFEADIKNDILRTQVFEKTTKTNNFPMVFEKSDDMGKAHLQLLKPIYFCNEKTSTCISAMMGNGAKIVNQVLIHNYEEGGTNEFKPKDPTDKKPKR